MLLGLHTDTEENVATLINITITYYDKAINFTPRKFCVFDLLQKSPAVNLF